LLKLKTTSPGEDPVGEHRRIPQVKYPEELPEVPNGIPIGSMPLPGQERLST
jgi:hypothetical protein